MFLLFPVSSGFIPWKDVGFCQKGFYASIEMVTWFLPLSVYSMCFSIQCVLYIKCLVNVSQMKLNQISP